MRILQVHNEHRFPTGEHAVVHAERDALRRAGHEVDVLSRDSACLASAGPLARARAMAGAFAARDVLAELSRLLALRRPDAAHVHNVFPLVSPAVYGALRRAGIPIVQTVHNFRFWCPCGTLYHRGRVYDAAAGRPLRAIRDRCYHDSLPLTAWMAAVLAWHRRAGSFDSIDLFIAPTEFVRRKLMDLGVAGERIRVKPHFVPDAADAGAADASEHPAAAGSYALFAGWLAPYKGIRTLVQAAQTVAAGGGTPAFHVLAAGGGPLLGSLRAEARAGISFLGARPRQEMDRLLAGSRFVVFPSECYETFGLIVIEAFRHGKAVIASDIGSAPCLVAEGCGGRLFPPGDAAALSECMRALWRDADLCQRYGAFNRGQYERLYTEKSNVERMLAIYAEAAGRCGRAARS